METFKKLPYDIQSHIYNIYKPKHEYDKVMEELQGVIGDTLNYFGLKLYYNKNEIMDEKNIYENLRSNKSILSVEEQRNIIYDGQRGSYDEKSIPDNLLSLISMAKEIDPKLTTKNVMDMVLRGITKDGEFKSYSDVTWSPNHEDLTKKLVGRCTGNARKNYALCLNSLAEANDIDLTKELIKLLRMQ